MLEANNLTFKAGSREIVSDVSVQFPPGGLTLVIGPNGAGKSTLIKLLAGLVRPHAGSVKYDGIDIRETNERELAKHRAVLSQTVEVAFPLSVKEVVMMGRYPHFGNAPGEVDNDIVAELLHSFDLTGLSDRNYQALSGGERQRVNFARVLAQISNSANTDDTRRRYLFLDEPLTFLDIAHQIEFMKRVDDFARSPNVVTVGVIHDLNIASRYADQIVVLHEGRVEAAGTGADVLQTDLIRRVFNVKPTFVPFDQSGMYMIFD